MELSQKRRLSKILFYRYFDLSQSSTYLKDEKMMRYSNRMMNIVSRYIKKGELFDWTTQDMTKNGLPRQLIEDIVELKRTGNIEYIVKYKLQIPNWLHPFVSPQYLDLTKLHDFVVEHKIQNRDDLKRYFNTAKGSTAFELMLYHCLTYMDSGTFPTQYMENNIFPMSPRNKIGNNTIFGTLHNHTTCSDGYCELMEVIDCGINCQYEYIGVSDHSKSTLLGIEYDDLHHQQYEIDRFNKRTNNIYVLKGIECEILADGNLDYSNEELKKFDYVIAGVHTNYNMDAKNAEKRIVKALENYHIDVLAHPSCRIYGSKPGFNLNMNYIIDACVSNKVVIEINGNKKRIDLDPKYVKYASNKGAYFELAADTHKKDDYSRINNAIYIAETCQIPKDQIINLKNKHELLTFLQKNK